MVFVVHNLTFSTRFFPFLVVIPLLTENFDPFNGMEVNRSLSSPLYLPKGVTNQLRRCADGVGRGVSCQQHQCYAVDTTISTHLMVNFVDICWDCYSPHCCVNVSGIITNCRLFSLTFQDVFLIAE